MTKEWAASRIFPGLRPEHRLGHETKEEKEAMEAASIAFWYGFFFFGMEKKYRKSDVIWRDDKSA